MRCGTQMLDSRAQFIFTTLGTTASSGNASAASAASSAWAVFPRPGSSASRNVRCPSAAAATTSAWCFISWSTPGSITSRASGSGIVVEAPLPTSSNDRNSGPSSSQPASRRAWPRFWEAAVKSGTRKGLASWRASTDCGTTRRSVAAGSSSRADGSSSSTSTPARSSIALRMSEAWSETLASSASRENSEGSRAAVWARIVAMPSSRLSSPSRLASVSVESPRTRVRSSRASSATAWNRERTETPWPRSTADSISRTARARIGIRPSLSRGRVRPWPRPLVRRDV